MEKKNITQIEELNHIISDSNTNAAGEIAHITGETPKPIEQPTKAQMTMMNLGRQAKLALQLQQAKSTERQKQLDNPFGLTQEERIKEEVKDQLRKSKAEHTIFAVP